MTDVAALAGVSKKTVSAVVNDVGQVSRATRERVRSAIAELGYSPNPVARGLTARRTGSVTLALPYLGSADLAAIASGVIAEGERRGFGVLCEPTDGAANAQVLRPMVGITDGVLLVPGRATTDLGGDVPVVVLGHRIVAADVDQVVASAAVAVAILVELVGPTGCIIIAEQDEADLVPDRWRSLLRTTGDASARSGSEAMHAAFAAEPGIRGVVTLGTGLGIGAAHAVSNAGLGIPEDIRLASVGAGAEPGFTVPGITTAAPALDVLVRTAMARLVERVAGFTGPAAIIDVPWIVTERGSTAR